MKETRRRQLFIAGTLLFLLTMVYGLIFPSLANPRVGLSGHLQAIFNSLFLIVLGLMWKELALGPKLEKAVIWLVLYGSYWVFFTAILAAAFPASRLLPLAGTGRFAEPWQENLVTFGLVSTNVAMLTCFSIVLWGLYRGGKNR